MTPGLYSKDHGISELAMIGDSQDMQSVRFPSDYQLVSGHASWFWNSKGTGT